MGIAERKQKEKIKMRKAILRTAMKLFLKEGFDRVTIRRIAEEIEYSPATIYLYFTDKNEILYALHIEGYEELYSRQQAITSVKDPLQRLRKHGEIYITFALENPEYYDLMFIMRGPVEKIREAKESDIGQRSFELLKKNVQDCMDTERIPRRDIDIVTFAFWSTVHGVASLIIRERCSMFPKEKLPLIARETLNFLMELVLK